MTAPLWTCRHRRIAMGEQGSYGLNPARQSRGDDDSWRASWPYSSLYLSARHRPPLMVSTVQKHLKKEEPLEDGRRHACRLPSGAIWPWPYSPAGVPAGSGSAVEQQYAVLVQSKVDTGLLLRIM